jgi:hypothetical protein
MTDHITLRMGATRISPRRLLTTILTVCALAAAGIASTNSISRAAENLGSVVSVNGVAQIERAGGTLAAVQGTMVQSRDRVSTSSGATLTLEFTDGSSIALGESTTVEIENADGSKTAANRVMLVSGRVHTVVPDRTTGASRTIEVDTPISKAVVPAPLN